MSFLMPFRKAKGRHRLSTAGGPVSTSGRRLHRVRIAGLFAVSCVAAYLWVVGTALLGGPDIVGPLLPEAFAPQTHASTHRPDAPTTSPSGRPSSVPVPGLGTNAPQHPPTAAPAVPAPPSSSTAPAPVTTAPGSQHPAPTSSPTPEHGRSTKAPGRTKPPKP